MVMISGKGTIPLLNSRYALYAMLREVCDKGGRLHCLRPPEASPIEHLLVMDFVSPSNSSALANSPVLIKV